MGRSRNAPSKKGIRGKNSETTRSLQKAPPSIPDLLGSAQSLMDQMNFESARRFVDRILERDPANSKGREMLGLIEIEDGNIDAARKAFSSLIPPSPTSPSPPPYSAYLYLAQLTDDDPREALAYYQSAVDLLLKETERGNNQPQASEKNEDVFKLKLTTISALVGMVEIWMSSDLCFEPEAEQTCDNLVSLAIQSDPDNLEALECLASVRMSQNKPDDARSALERAWVLIKDLDPEDPNLPPISTRLSLTRRFLELSLFSPALVLLQGVIAADDEEMDAWYLQGWCLYLMAMQTQKTGEIFEDLSREELLQDARDCLDTCLALRGDDGEIMEHVDQLIKELDAAGIHPSKKSEEDEDGDESWESEEEEGSDVEMG
ncbi:TPR-like protein [Cantharellus anzutake]|uniref:TPR-like protein n=1 Tax=Cantharellus anzutake TaxID=1750568 RepID=UPI001903D43C|nr:TPR-like protein [Cantharellus anzutake]KAF8340566.1 TPR-like protein [Cantharellus anzutake]